MSELMQVNSVQATGYSRMIELAMQQDNLDKLEKMMELQEAWEKREAEKAFHQSFAAFKAECPTLLKTSKGHNSYYVGLGMIVEAAIPALSKHGLSHCWDFYQRLENNKPYITVKCILTHNQGHSRSVEMSSYADENTLMNAIQKIASAKTYLERYTLLAITGLAVKDMDDDGRSAVAMDVTKTLNAEQVSNIEQMMQEAGVELPRIQKHFNIATLGEIPIGKYGELSSLLQSAKNKKNKEAA